MLALAELLRRVGVALRVLNLGGGDVDTSTPMGSMVFTVMAALAQMELEIKREGIGDSVSKRREARRDLGGRRQIFTASQIRNAAKLIAGGESAKQVAQDLGMSRATLYRRIWRPSGARWRFVIRRVRKVAISERPDVRRHLSADSEVTQERITEFADAPVAVQLLVLGELKARAKDQSNSFVPAITAAAFAIIAIFISVIPENLRFATAGDVIADPLARWIANLIGMLFLGLLAVGLLIPMMCSAVKDNASRARRWNSEHPL